MARAKQPGGRVEDPSAALRGPSWRSRTPQQGGGLPQTRARLKLRSVTKDAVRCSRFPFSLQFFSPQSVDRQTVLAAAASIQNLIRKDPEDLYSLTHATRSPLGANGARPGAPWLVPPAIVRLRLARAACLMARINLLP